MNLFKRWTSSVYSSFDWMISQVENHEALVTSALREMKQAGGKANAQLKQIQRDGAAMRSRLAELEQAETSWKERALKAHESDRERALECLQRKKAVENERKALSEQLQDHEKFEKQLTADLKVIEQRIAELKRKKHTLCARQHRSDALRASAPEEIGLIAEIDDIFERWEIKLDQREEFSFAKDSFEEEFVAEESREALNAELDQIVADSLK